MELNALCSSSTFNNLSTGGLPSRCLQIHRGRATHFSFPSSSNKVSLSAKFSAKRNGVQASIAEIEPSLKVKSKAVELSDVLKGTSIFLVGMSGSMKSTVAKVLADALRYYYFDSDNLVVQAMGGEFAAKSCKENDDEGFQNSETEVLKQLSSLGRLVVCAGDGSVQSSTNLGYLRYGISIWIDVPLDMLVKDARDKTETIPFTWPISASDSLIEVVDKLAKVYEELKGGYATADARVSLQSVALRLGYDDMEAVTPEDMAFEALKEIEKLTRVKKLMEEAARPF